MSTVHCYKCYGESIDALQYFLSFTLVCFHGSVYCSRELVDFIFLKVFSFFFIISFELRICTRYNFSTKTEKSVVNSNDFVVRRRFALNHMRI